MTQRIALAILVTVWATLVAAGFTAYVTARNVLLSELDSSLVARAASLPEIVDENGRKFTPVSSVREGDQAIVQDETHRTVARYPATAAATFAPQLLRAAFVALPGGARARTVTLRAMAQPVGGGPPEPVTVIFRGSAEAFDHVLRRLAIALGITGMLGGALAALVARGIARRALLPLRSTAETVGAIDESSLDRRIAEDSLPPELVPVATRINGMLGRIQDSMEQRRQFIADASHELRTPVAAITAALEVALRRPRDVAGYREALQSSLVDAHLLQRLVEALLSHARSGQPEAQYSVEVVNVADLVQECAIVVASLAEARNIRLDLSGNEDLVLRTQPDRLRSILLNLLGNAVEYNRDGGQICVCCRAEGDTAVIEVRDTGVGIPPEHVAHLFEPFYRVDGSRAAGHMGLGLHLVQTHARALGGICTVQSVLGSGSTFQVRLSGLVQGSGNVPRIQPEVVAG